MSYYENQPSWSAPGRQPSWEQQVPPSRSGTNSTVQRDDATAFSTQFEEVDRAADNLLKSGKMFPMMGGAPGRRDSMPGMGGPRPYSEFGGSSRHHSVSDYDAVRPGSSHNLQGYYANQRYQPRQNEAEQMMQQKRRMAAQRERELRNYHQEQQYNRIDGTGMSGPKSDRSMSPNAMSEEERRELIARQHRALYGNESQLYTGEGSTPRQGPQDARIATNPATGRGNSGGSPLAFDPFGTQNPGSAVEPSVQMPPRDQIQKQDQTAAGKQNSRRNSNSSPSSQPNSYSLFENAQQSSRTSTSSPAGSPPLAGNKSQTTTGPAPIGTRPAQSQNPSAGSGGLKQRSTTPLPSPLSYGFTANDQNNSNERSTSAASNPNQNVTEKNVGLGGWGSNSGVWGTSKNLGVQASVWG
ncbi:MAG: hypothetical protein M1820_001807 [Bogoriella megaspora]|nr:MAG: hypothetical protein M1820_001807 [Bogoriella megaspora]